MSHPILFRLHVVTHTTHTCNLAVSLFCLLVTHITHITHKNTHMWEDTLIRLIDVLEKK